MNNEFWHQASDGKSLFVRKVQPQGAPRGIVHLAHGLGEHSERYLRVAGQLAAEGYVVFADDHRGHGKTAATPAELGAFGSGGIHRVVDDLVALMRFEKLEHPNLPFVLFGHSMGSYLAQEFMLRHANEVDAVVLSASAGKPSALASVGRYVARLERLRLGATGKSSILRGLSFDAFNKPFAGSGPTKFEWLSRDRAEVDKYVADPLCGFEATTSLWVDLLDLLGEISRPERQALLPKSLPVRIISGGEDPANERAKGARQLAAALQTAGLTKVELVIYEGARHELLNETNRDDVTRELIGWLNTHVPRKS
jgi:alpha-beta hydrolase superfamily lysophospholipase